MLPVRCYTCNKVLGHLEQDLQKWIHEHITKGQKDSLEDFYDTNNIRRLCCRKILLTYHNENYLKHSHSQQEIPSSVTLQKSSPYTQLYRAV